MPDDSIALNALCDRYVAAQLSGDRREALRLVVEEGLAAGHPVHALQCEVVQAAQREIGRLWQQNRITIAQEHMATAISQVALSRLFEEARPLARLGYKVIVTCVQGEYHEFPARLVADFLDIGGFDVRYLGANVPHDHLVAMIGQEKPDLLALSVTMSYNARSLREAVSQVRSPFPELPILVGGHALQWEPRLAIEAGVETCDADADCVVKTAQRLVLRGGSR